LLESNRTARVSRTEKSRSCLRRGEHA
jgi:hypothetical protein